MLYGLKFKNVLGGFMAHACMRNRVIRYSMFDGTGPDKSGKPKASGVTKSSSVAARFKDRLSIYPKNSGFVICSLMGREWLL